MKHTLECASNQIIRVPCTKENCNCKCHRSKPKRISKAQIYRALGLVPVRGAVSGKIYWE